MLFWTDSNNEWQRSERKKLEHFLVYASRRILVVFILKTFKLIALSSKAVMCHLLTPYLSLWFKAFMYHLLTLVQSLSSKAAMYHILTLLSSLSSKAVMYHLLTPYLPLRFKAVMYHHYISSLPAVYHTVCRLTYNCYSIRRTTFSFSFNGKRLIRDLYTLWGSQGKQGKETYI